MTTTTTFPLIAISKDDDGAISRVDITIGQRWLVRDSLAPAVTVTHIHPDGKFDCHVVDKKGNKSFFGTYTKGFIDPFDFSGKDLEVFLG